MHLSAILHFNSQPKYVVFRYGSLTVDFTGVTVTFSFRHRPRHTPYLHQALIKLLSKSVVVVLWWLIIVDESLPRREGWLIARSNTTLQICSPDNCAADQSYSLTT